MHSPGPDNEEEERLALYRGYGKPTEAYLGYLAGKNIFDLEKVKILYNLAAGSADESLTLEVLFPSAQIYTVEQDGLGHTDAVWKFKDTGITERTKFIQGDLFDVEIWEGLPDNADVILIQHPQISGMFTKTKIALWLKLAHDKMNDNACIIICIKESTEMKEWPHISSQINRYFDEVINEQNPHRTHSGQSHLIVLKKKGGMRNFIGRKKRHQKKLLEILEMRGEQNRPPLRERLLQEKRPFENEATSLSKIPLSDVPGENTRRYLAYIIEKCGLQSDAMKVIHNLACGAAEESPFLEELFPNAQITGIDKNAASVSWAKDITKKCPRTTISEADLYEKATWKHLKKADIILLQQPQLSGFDTRTYIEAWIPEIAKKLTQNGIFILCLMCPADLEGFYEAGIFEGDKSPAEICDTFFEMIMNEENPYGSAGTLRYLMVFRKKAKNQNVSKRMKEILKGH